MTAASSGLDPETITTAEELDALPENSVIRDSMGDVGVLFGGRVWYPETTPLARLYVGLHYLPATLLYRPDRPPLPTVQRSADAWWQEYSDEAEAHAKLRSGIEALADEWEADEREHEAMAETLADTLDIATTRRDVILRHRRLAHQHASALRALLPADDEPEVSA